MHYVICPFSKPKFAENLVSSLRRQTFRNFVPIVVENGDGVGASILPDGGIVLQSGRHQSLAKNAALDWMDGKGGGSWSVFDCDDYYGPGYLEDHMSYLSEGAGVAGKAFGSLMYVEFEDGLYLDGLIGPLKKTRFFTGGATSCSTSRVPRFPTVKTGEDKSWYEEMMGAGAKTVNTGARHYCYNRVGGNHTWSVDGATADFFRRRMLYLGNIPRSECERPARELMDKTERVTKVVMLHTPDYEPAKVSVPDMRAYCRTWSYDFVHHGILKRQDWPHAWNKMLAIEEAMRETREGDWVLWMDCDMVMMRLERTLESMLAKDKDFMVSVDGNGMCMGFFFIRNVPLMRSFVQELIQNFRDSWPWEQDVAKGLVASRPEYAERTGFIPESVVMNPMSRPSRSMVVRHYWGNLGFRDNKAGRGKMVETMEKDILLRDAGRTKFKRPWMR